MITCLGDALYPRVGVAAVQVLRDLGVAVDFPAGQTCCGQPASNSGFRDSARQRERGLDLGLVRGDGPRWLPRPLRR